ncbi:hypothetical protein [Streptomyces sp. BPTC-684]|uniref:hypothetical protein n=1 Tax=Streptomyces sp. BPTC-684 TaxID=3043734 RepID=UPI0024B071E9|nr:hypothetical protein [Streptomyces sp. BPTC-684]WHM36741.1 hypothetical protein QIY60_07450 [Streptomyces sp. BPTC-684]
MSTVAIENQVRTGGTEAQAETEAGTSVQAGTTVQPEIKGLPTWYFPLVGCFAGVFDIARAYPVVYWLIPVVAALNIALTLTVLRARMRYMQALWKNKRTRLLALDLLGVRFAVRFGLGFAGLAMGAASGGLVVGIVMAVLGTAMAWGDQWLILRTLKRAQA